MFQEEMRHLGVGARAEFAGWLAAEKAYLKSLSKEPEQETLQMEYYQKLVNLQDTKYVFLSLFL
jgi:putative SOS response-associated peptidase YedK